MSKPTPAEYRAYEFNIEPACAAILKDAGQPVVSPFLNALGLDGTPINLATAKDDSCFVSYEPDTTSDEVRAFRENAAVDGGYSSEAAGAAGTIIVTRRVPMGDMPAKEGETPDCYIRLCQELGKIRAAFLDTGRPFKDSLPNYDFQSIIEMAPNRQVDGPRAANQAVLRFGVKFLPADGAW